MSEEERQNREWKLWIRQMRGDKIVACRDDLFP